MSVLLVIVSLPLYVLMLWPLVIACRRILGVRIGTIRALLAAAFGWTIAGVVVGTVDHATANLGRNPGVFFGLLIPYLGAGFLASLMFLFVTEMALPGGTGLLGSVRSLRRRFTRARRYAQIGRIAVKHGLGPYLTGRKDPVDSDQPRAKLARSLRRALEDGGVTFVKLGQVLSTRPDLLPPVFIEELSRLQDQVSRAPAEEIQELLRTELGASPEEIFGEFDPEPLAAASIAQVYPATLRTGERVVVKVQRPGVAEVVERDLDIVRRIAGALDLRARWARAFGVVELAEGFAEALLEELDFRVEAANIAAVSSAGSTDGRVRLPVVYDQLSTERVLVMQRLDGTPLGKAAAEVPEPERAPLATALLDLLLRQVMLHGVFHADPHPGNVLLLGDGNLGLLDFGSVGRLDTGLRDGLAALLGAADRGDAAGMRDGLLSIVDRPDRVDEQRLERALGALVAKHFSDQRAPDVTMFTDMFRIIADFELAVPAPIAAVFRALATMEGTLSLLAPGFNIVAGSRAFATAQINEQLQPENLRETATQELLALLPVVRRLPRRLDRIGGALEQGRLSVNVRLFADERDRRVVTGWLHEILLAFVGAATGLMAVLLLASTGGPRVLADLTLNHVFGYNLLAISGLVGLRLLFVVFRTQRRNDSGG